MASLRIWNVVSIPFFVGNLIIILSRSSAARIPGPRISSPTSRVGFFEPLLLLSSVVSSSPEHRKTDPFGCSIVRVPAAAGVVSLRDVQAPELNLGIGWLRFDPGSVRARSRQTWWGMAPRPGQRSPQNHRLGLRSVNPYVTAGSQAKSEMDEGPPFFSSPWPVTRAGCAVYGEEGRVIAANSRT